MRDLRQRRLRNLAQNRLALAAIEVARAVDVPLQVALVDEARERVLLEAGNRARVETHGINVARQQLRRQHHVADAQAGHHGFREGVQVNHLVGCVVGEQRHDQAAAVAELAVVIVLDDVTFARAVRPLEQFQAPLDGHDDARGKMVCRRNVHHVGARFLKLVHQQARFVDGNRPPGVAERLGDGGELAIAGVFHGERGGGPEHLQQTAVQVLATRADDDAVGRNVHAACAPQIRRDGAAQLGQAVERDRSQQVVAGKRKRLAHVAPPHRSRE